MTLNNTLYNIDVADEMDIFGGKGVDLQGKAMYYDFNSNANETTKYTVASAGAGSSVTKNTTTLGAITLKVGGAFPGGIKSASVLGNCTFQTGDYSTIIVEFEFNTLTTSSTTTSYQSVGLSPNASFPPGSNLQSNSIGIGFYLDGNTSNNLKFGTVNSSGTQEVTTNVAYYGMDANSWHWVRFEITGYGTAIRCAGVLSGGGDTPPIYGILPTLVHTTYLPSTTTELAFHAMCYNSGAGATNTFAVRRVRIALIP